MINPIFYPIAALAVFLFLASFLGKKATILLMGGIILISYIVLSGLGF
jgi:hypothetical protein